MKLTGTWKENKLQEGKWEQANGNFFQGNFSENMPSGDGVWNFTNGNVQHGNYTVTKKETEAEADPEAEVQAGPEYDIKWRASKHIVESALRMKRNEPEN